MFEFLGDVERGVSALYPYRVLITVATLAVAVGVAGVAWRNGWLAATLRAAQRRPVASAALLAVALLVTVPAGWYLASPLWTRTTLVEESPLAVARGTGSSSAASASTSTSPPTPAADSAPTTTTGAAEPTAVGAPVEPVQPAAGAAAGSTPSSEASAEFIAREVQSGEWLGADEFHFAEGRALIVETEPNRYILRVEDFSIRNGPDLFLYLSPSPDGYADGGLNLGALKATDGAFNYEVPAGTDLSAFRSAVVWCEQFAVLFATATLHTP